MGIAINFDNQFNGWRIEIYNIGTDEMLTAKSDS